MAAVILLAATAAGSAPASAQMLAVGSPPVAALSEDSAEIQYSAEFGVSTVEARTRLALQASLSDAATRIVGTVPADQLAGVWIDNGRDYRLVVDLVRGADPSLAIKAADIAGLPVVVTADRSSSLATVAEAVSAGTAEWARQVPGLNGVGVDERTGEIVFYVDRAKATPQSVDAARLTSLPSRVEYDSSAGSDQMYGGLKLTSCTAGFTAKNSTTGVKGYFTAAHCGTQSYYFPNTGGSWFTSSYQSQRHDGFTDIQFRKYDSHSPKAYFYGASSTTLTAQVGTSPPSTGTYVCHRGKTTGYRCGSVTSTTYAPTWSGACLSATCQPVWVRTTAYGLPGDSGGPWFLGSNGVIGIHKGGADDGSYTVYAKIEYRPGATNVCTASTCP